jgi:hypothetical protein
MATSYGMYISGDESAKLDQELDAIIDSIKNCHDLESARQKVQELKSLSEMLAISHYRYGISISKKQKNVVALFDWGYPGQDPDVLAFQAIRSGTYMGTT